VGGRIILKRILMEKCVSCALGSFDWEKGRVAGSCEHSDEPSGSIKCGEFLD
jgi:hypothetical protein